MNFIVRVSTSAEVNHLAGFLYRIQSPFIVIKQEYDLWAELFTIIMTRRICPRKKI